MTTRKSVLDIISRLGIKITPEVEGVIALLLKSESLNETNIAEKLEMRINDVRKVLYALGKLEVVYYVKDKHPEKKWWYIYSWTLDVNKIYIKYIEFLKKQLKKKEEALADTALSFACKGCERKMEYSDALACNFRCTHCGKMLREAKRKDLVKLEKDIKKLGKEIEEHG